MLKIIGSVLLASAVSVTYAKDAKKIAAGKAKAAVCAACHGQKGISAVPLYPNLAGQKEAYTVKQLQDFKSKTRKDPVMAGQVAALTKTDMENLAAYYSSLK